MNHHLDRYQDYSNFPGLMEFLCDFDPRVL